MSNPSALVTAYEAGHYFKDLIERFHHMPFVYGDKESVRFQNCEDFHPALEKAIAATGSKNIVLNPVKNKSGYATGGLGDEGGYYSNTYFDLSVTGASREELEKVGQEMLRQYAILTDFEKIPEKNDYDFSWSQHSLYIKPEVLDLQSPKEIREVRKQIKDVFPVEVIDKLGAKAQREAQNFWDAFDRLATTVDAGYYQPKTEEAFTQSIQKQRKAAGFDTLQELARASIEDDTHKVRAAKRKESYFTNAKK